MGYVEASAAMRTRFVILAAFIISPVLAGMESGSPPAGGEGGRTAEAKEGRTPGNPRPIKVGVYILNMGKLDVTSGSFSVDFYLSLKSEGGEIPETFEFLNGRAASIEKLLDRPSEKFYRVLANLTTPIDFQRFPFDAQQLQIVIEDKQNTIGEVVYVPDGTESGMDPGVFFPGWKITGWTSHSGRHDYPPYGETFSKYVFTVNIERIKLNSFIKTFLPVLFMMLIVASSFILNPDQSNTRLATISSSLVASAMFHISISNQIPPVAYLTFADKFMLTTYFILLSSFFLNIAIFVLQSREKKEPAARFHRISKAIVFVGMPLGYAALFLLG
ncbi:MAG: hypothetical protein N3A38_15150 [Planctomycetota bacterium]|nr:hypothetical protein [Planctomycetota bacterium]